MCREIPRVVKVHTQVQCYLHNKSYFLYAKKYYAHVSRHLYQWLQCHGHKKKKHSATTVCDTVWWAIFCGVLIFIVNSLVMKYAPTKIN